MDLDEQARALVQLHPGRGKQRSGMHAKRTDADNNKERAMLRLKTKELAKAMGCRPRDIVSRIRPQLTGRALTNLAHRLNRGKVQPTLRDVMALRRETGISDIGALVDDGG